MNEVGKTHQDKDGGQKQLSNLSVRSYLDQTVTPLLLKAMIEVSKEK